MPATASCCARTGCPTSSTTATLAATLQEGEPQESVARLVEIALANQTRDNVTAIVADVIEEE